MGFFSRPMDEVEAFRICSNLQALLGAHLWTSVLAGRQPQHDGTAVWAKVLSMQTKDRRNLRQVQEALGLMEARYPGLVESMADHMIDHMQAGGMPGRLQGTSFADEKKRWELSRAGR